MNGDGSMEVRKRSASSRFFSEVVDLSSEPTSMPEPLSNAASLSSHPLSLIHTLSFSQGTEIVIRAATGSLAQMRHVVGQFPLVRMGFFFVDAGRRRLLLLFLLDLHHHHHLFNQLVRSRSLFRSLRPNLLEGTRARADDATKGRTRRGPFPSNRFNPPPPPHTHTHTALRKNDRHRFRSFCFRPPPPPHRPARSLTLTLSLPLGECESRPILSKDVLVVALFSSKSFQPLSTHSISSSSPFLPAAKKKNLPSPPLISQGAPSFRKRPNPAAAHAQSSYSASSWRLAARPDPTALPPPPPVPLDRWALMTTTGNEPSSSSAAPPPAPAPPSSSALRDTHVSTPEAGLLSRGGYFLLFRDDVNSSSARGDGSTTTNLVAVPVEEWHTFRPPLRHAVPTLEEAEAAMEARA